MCVLSRQCVPTFREIKEVELQSSGAKTFPLIGMNLGSCCVIVLTTHLRSRKKENDFTKIDNSARFELNRTIIYIQKQKL